MRAIGKCQQHQDNISLRNSVEVVYVHVVITCAAFLVKYLEQCSIRLFLVDIDARFVYHAMMEVGITLPRLVDIYDHLFKSRVMDVVCASLSFDSCCRLTICTHASSNMQKVTHQK